jgi:hypothetical protein
MFLEELDNEAHFHPSVFEVPLIQHGSSLRIVAYQQKAATRIKEIQSYVKEGDRRATQELSARVRRALIDG